MTAGLLASSFLEWMSYQVDNDSLYILREARSGKRKMPCSKLKRLVARMFDRSSESANLGTSLLDDVKSNFAANFRGMLEPFAADAALKIGQGLVSALQEIFHRSSVESAEPGLQAQARSQKAAKPVKREIVICLELLATAQKDIQGPRPVRPGQQKLPQFQERIPRRTRRRVEEFLYNSRRVAPPVARFNCVHTP